MGSVGGQSYAWICMERVVVALLSYKSQRRCTYLPQSNRRSAGDEQSWRFRLTIGNWSLQVLSCALRRVLLITRGRPIGRVTRRMLTAMLEQVETTIQ